MSVYDWSRHLQAGEEVLWQGRPDAGVRLVLRGWDIWLLPLAFGITGFGAMLLILSATGEGANLLPQAVLTVLAGLYLGLGRAWLDGRRRAWLRYAVTTVHILRANGRSGRLISADPITPSLAIDVIPGRLTTIRLNPWRKGGPNPQDVFPANLVDPFGLSEVLFGYVERGNELRMLPDGRDVADLIKGLKANSIEGTAA